MIRQIELSDAKAICEIYNHHVQNTIVTFEEEPVPEEEMKNRIIGVTNKFPWLVYEEKDTVVGYAYATEWRGRTAYRFSAESTIYLHQSFTGKGIGAKLYKQLIDEVKQKEVHSLIGGISLPNNGSIALHEKLKFKKVAHFCEVGFKLNRWIDVGYWQLMLEK
jgi:L-amino acid N-acyltransferase YncA